jgi:hypothetical protein
MEGKGNGSVRVHTAPDSVVVRLANDFTSLSLFSTDYGYRRDNRKRPELCQTGISYAIFAINSQVEGVITEGKFQTEAETN